MNRGTIARSDDQPLPSPPFASIDDAIASLAAVGYVTDRATATVAYLAGALGKSLLLEGPAGVGKTELAKAVARASGRRILRLQCYEGLDESRALYEWEHGKQLLYTQLLRDALREVIGVGADLSTAVRRIAEHESAFFHERFLVARPLLAALQSEKPVVLLIDEVDRGDPELEALLLEVLSDYQVTIPELGTHRAKTRPYVVLTSNATREITPALRRRCLHLFLDYPSRDRERAILDVHLPDASDVLVAQVVDFVQSLRDLDLNQAPSVAETLDWARALVVLHAGQLDAELVRNTLGVLSKHREDQERIAAATPALLGKKR